MESPNNNIEAEDVKEISHNVNNEPAKTSENEAKYVTLDHPKVSKKVCINSCIQFNKFMIIGKF